MSLRLRPLTVRTRLTLWYTSALLVILAVIGVLSHRVLAWSLGQELDASLVAVARALRAAAPAPSPEDALRQLLGPEAYDKLFQFLDPLGQPGRRSSTLRQRGLPLSADARGNAARGASTFETLTLDDGERVRLLTMPVVERGRTVQLIQVGMPLTRTEEALRQFRTVLLALLPLGAGLAAIGGAAIARRALRPVEGMSRAARRITAQALSERIPLRGTDDELDHLAGTLNGMLGRLEEAFAQMRRFTADAAHELRTPLTVLKGSLEVALRADRSPAEYREALRGSLEEVDRLTRVAEDLLLLSRASAGAAAGRPRVELEPLLLEAFDAGLSLARASGVTVRLGPVTSGGTVMGDASALRRAVLNLVDNAVKYTPAGGGVTLSLARDGGFVVIAVEDTGMGIEAADQDRIFQPFVRLDEARSRETGGSGLGLAIARSIVAAHRGSLTVTSAPKAGSRFVIRLPAAEAG